MKTLRVEEGHVIQVPPPIGETDRTYVVEQAMFGGGSDGRDAYPDSWQVRARRLNADGTYDPKGPMIAFVQEGQRGSHCYSNAVAVAILGTMTKSYI
jgi:hypothetical protein